MNSARWCHHDNNPENISIRDAGVALRF